MLTLIKELEEKTNDGRRMGLYQCNHNGCTNTAKIGIGNVERGHTRSCGCMRMDGLITSCATHRMSKSSEYRIWGLIKNRCYNPKCPEYPYYGGRGIKMSEEWKKSFEAFYRDMGPRPFPKAQADRYPSNDGDYEKDNCRWTTPRKNANNRGNTIRLELFGLDLPFSEWVDIVGTEYHSLYNRIVRGWDVERMLLTPFPNGPSKITIMFRITLAKKGCFQPK